MTIMGCGQKLQAIWNGEGSMIGDPVAKHFKMRRPKGIPFTWTNVRLNLEQIMHPVNHNLLI